MIREKEDYLILTFLRLTVALGFLASVFISYNLWNNQDRVLPCIPVWSVLQISVSPPVSMFLFFILIFSAAAIVLMERPAVFMIIHLAATSLLVLLDINRLQPYIYMYMILEIVLLLYYTGVLQVREVIVTFRLVLTAIYFWSGIHKINQDYHEVIYMWFAAPVLNLFQNETFMKIVDIIGYVSPLFETCLAVGLLLPATRRVSAVLAIMMHLLILLLVCFSKQFNFSILPWNLSMIALVFLLFYKNRQQQMQHLREFLKIKTIVPVLLLVWIFPAFRFAGYWDTYLAHDLYSGKAKFGFLYFNEQVKNRLPEEYKKYIEVAAPDQYYISLTKWSMEEVKVPVYPEIRVFEKYRDFLKQYADEGEKIVLVSYTHKKPVIIE